MLFVLSKSGSWASDHFTGLATHPLVCGGRSVVLEALISGGNPISAASTAARMIARQR